VSERQTLSRIGTDVWIFALFQRVALRLRDDLSQVPLPARPLAWTHAEVRLQPANPNFKPIVLKPESAAEVRPVAQLLEVLSGPPTMFFASEPSP
jgi:hypothetical protein